MQRREFCKIMAGAGLAASFPLASTIGRAADADGTADPGSPTSFPVSDWEAVVKEGWGTNGAAGGPGTWDGVPLQSPAIPDLTGDGPFEADWQSLHAYEAPEWYRDAKFGIWAHWSPQCVPEDSDWYARNMYIQGERQYKNQLQHYGHPSKFGYKDLCANGRF